MNTESSLRYIVNDVLTKIDQKSGILRVVENAPIGEQIFGFLLTLREFSRPEKKIVAQLLHPPSLQIKRRLDALCSLSMSLQFSRFVSVPHLFSWSG